jgi:hypothetical protein
MEATGLLASTRSAARKKLEATAAKAAKPATKPDGSSKVASTISAVALETAVDEVVAVHIKAFVTQFAAEGGQKTSFSATAPQALFLVNGTLIRDWLKPTTSNLTGRLSKLDDQPAIAEELYIGILNRPPTPAEQAEVIGYLAATADRTAAITELTWALLLSAEFRFNH